MIMLPIDPRQRRPGFPFQDDFFTLGAPVGPDQPNRREDVIRVETKHATPELQGVRASEWKEGEKIKGPDDPPLKPGTALATFEAGRYQNKSTGNHAVVFDRYGEEGGRKGMWVLDQSNGNVADRRFIAFDNQGGRRTSQAEKYSVIRRP